MPVIIQEGLPAIKELTEKNIFVMNTTRAKSQDIRPLKICILNLMPNKIVTETQLLKQLSNSIIQIEITLLMVKDHKPKNTNQSHLDTFYRYFDEIKDQYFDALIITGAPVEQFKFEEVNYWNELKKIFEWSKTNVFTSLFICWAAQAALYHFYKVDKVALSSKLSGVYPHDKLERNDYLFMGLNKTFYCPHSRHTQSDKKSIENCQSLDILAYSNSAGINIVSSKDRSQLFFAGHFEYDLETLQDEYLRDTSQGLDTKIPENYFIDNDVNKAIKGQWFSDASLIFSNWLNYYVYQSTNYDLKNKIFSK